MEPDGSIPYSQKETDSSHEFSPHLTSYLFNISFNNILPSTHVFLWAPSKFYTENQSEHICEVSNALTIHCGLMVYDTV